MKDKHIRLELLRVMVHILVDGTVFICQYAPNDKGGENHVQVSIYDLSAGKVTEIHSALRHIDREAMFLFRVFIQDRIFQ